MNLSTVDRIANAVLYEGYILYPYRASSRKNRQRFTFGRVYPQDYGKAQNGAEPFAMQTECLLRNRGEMPTLEVRMRFLHPVARTIGLLAAPVPKLPADIEPSSLTFVPEVRVDDKLFQTWQEAVEREVRSSRQPIDSLANQALSIPFHFSSSLTFEPIQNCEIQKIIGAIVRRQQSLQGTMDIAVQPLNGQVFKIKVTVRNQTSLSEAELYRSDEVLMRTFASTHTILESDSGEFLSLID